MFFCCINLPRLCSLVIPCPLSEIFTINKFYMKRKKGGGGEKNLKNHKHAFGNFKGSRFYTYMDTIE